MITEIEDAIVLIAGITEGPWVLTGQRIRHAKTGSCPWCELFNTIAATTDNTEGHFIDMPRWTFLEHFNSQLEEVVDGVVIDRIMTAADHNSTRPERKMLLKMLGIR